MTQAGLAQRLREPGPKRLLALDGGGLRGLVTLGYLSRIEKILRERHGRKDLVLSDYFDLVGGTSTGAIIATMLALGHSVEEIRQLYLTLGRDAFVPMKYFLGALGRLLGARFDESPLEKLLRDYLGTRTLASPDLRVGLMVVARRADTGSVWTLVNVPEQKFFAMNKDILLWEIVRSSTAAPTYFRPRVISDVGAGEEALFVDGGVSMHNNPALQLLFVATLEGFALRWPMGEENLLLCSVGTGSFLKLPTRDKLRRYNNLEWAGLSIQHLMHDASELNQTVLQVISNSPTAMMIDRQIGTLAQDGIVSAPLLSYIRYDIDLEKAALAGVGLEYPRERVENLWKMSEVGNLSDLDKIGTAAAQAQVKEEHFPRAFDRLSEPRP